MTGSEKQSIIGSLVSERTAELAALEESELMKKINQMWVSVKAKPPKVECRVVNGSFTVTRRFEVHDVSGQGVDEEEGRSKRATQQIENVISAGPLIALFRKAYKQISTMGHAFVEESKAIVDGVNLRLEGGKMYLILGAPGSGKSTLLKMIANTLRQDKCHVVGGDITVNGISPKDPAVVWSVRVDGKI
jgi:ABC-type transport system involved in cytochrome bd biosynthesis fused ATPase/permease subunit